MTKPNKFRSWRHSQGWTLDDIAGITGVSVSNLSRIENGVVIPRPATRVHIAHALGKRVSDLFEPIDEDENEVIA